MAVRLGLYKAHFWTGKMAYDKRGGFKLCRGQVVKGLLAGKEVDHSEEPLLFHLGRDPGETLIIDPTTAEVRPC